MILDSVCVKLTLSIITDYAQWRSHLATSDHHSSVSWRLRVLISAFWFCGKNWVVTLLLSLLLRSSTKDRRALCSFHDKSDQQLPITGWEGRLLQNMDELGSWQLGEHIWIFNLPWPLKLLFWFLSAILHICFSNEQQKMCYSLVPKDPNRPKVV